MKEADTRTRQHTGGPRQRIGVLFLMEAFTAVGVNLLQVGIFFYTHHQFGWGLKENFLLATGQGTIYVVGALLAGRVSALFGRRRTLVAVWLAMSAAAAAMIAASPAVVAVLLLVHALFNGLNWPAMESLVSSGVDSQTLSRRLAVYNLVWSGAGAMTIAVTGSIIAYFPAGFFLLATVVHAAAAGVLLVFFRSVMPPHDAEGHGHVEVEPELLRKRTLALWLSRIGMPAAFMVNYSLMAMMPELPVMQQLDPAQQTVISSVWLAGRWVAFLMLGWMVWWHTRPRALLAAAVVMLTAFLGVTIRPSALFGFDPVLAIDLASMIGWQVALGLSIGLIYSASLYFGMVLSEGSTEHGGYHEALVGLGSILGPGSGLIGQWVRPAEVYAGVTGVAAVIGLSVLAAACASVLVGRERRGGGQRERS